MSDVVVPRLGVTATEVTIVGWLVEDGSTVEAGEPILTVATDKTEIDIEATQSGVLRQRAEPDEEYSLGAVIGAIE